MYLKPNKIFVDDDNVEIYNYFLIGVGLNHVARMNLSMARKIKEAKVNFL